MELQENLPSREQDRYLSTNPEYNDEDDEEANYTLNPDQVPVSADHVGNMGRVCVVYT